MAALFLPLTGEERSCANAPSPLRARESMRLRAPDNKRDGDGGPSHPYDASLVVNPREGGVAWVFSAALVSES